MNEQLSQVREELKIDNIIKNQRVCLAFIKEHMRGEGREYAQFYEMHSLLQYPPIPDENS